MNLILVALTMAPAANPKAADVRGAVAFLTTHQLPSGGFVTTLPGKGEAPVPSLRTTRTAVRAYRLLGADVPNPDRVAAFTLACHDAKTGGFADRPGAAPDPVATAVALMVLRELKRPEGDYLGPGLAFVGEKTAGFEQIRMAATGLEELGKTVPQQKKWAAEVEAGRNPDGSYGKGPGAARATALNAVALQRLGGRVDAAAVLKVLRAGLRAYGGFGGDAAGGSDLEACYRVVRLFDRLKAKPDRPADLDRFIASCKHKDGTYSTKSGDPPSLHATYHAAELRHWLGGDK